MPIAPKTQVLAQISKPKEVDRGQIFSLEPKHDHAEDSETVPPTRGMVHWLLVFFFAFTSVWIILLCSATSSTPTFSYATASQNQVVGSSLSHPLEIFDWLLSKTPIAFSCIWEYSAYSSQQITYCTIQNLFENAPMQLILGYNCPFAVTAYLVSFPHHILLLIYSTCSGWLSSVFETASFFLSSLATQDLWTETNDSWWHVRGSWTYQSGDPQNKSTVCNWPFHSQAQEA